MTPVGYEFLRQTLQLTAFAPRCPALLKPVTRVEPTDGFLAIPQNVAPDSNDPLEHVLFALKHEGTDLQILAEALPKIEAGSLLAALRQSPSGGYIRTACYLWEQFARERLTELPEITGPTVELFDSERYITGLAVRDPRWRVSFNGLGSISYCATVRRTEYLRQAIRSDVLGRTREFITSLGKGVLDRTLAWAYLHETEDSFAIERETPSEDKARAFIAVLQQAHEGRPLSEEYLVELQNSVLTSPFDKAASYRVEQNWLRGPGRGAAGVTYLPPPAELARELMDYLTTFANDAPRVMDPLIAASVASFGFVFIHPFLDGNGRLSRFIFHHALCRSGKLEKGLILPVSVAMKRNETDYLTVLQGYSKQARERWSVRWIDEGVYDMRFNGRASIYRYWDASHCVEFGYRMAEQALEFDLRHETEFLVRYDKILKAVNERFDLRGSDLSTLVVCCLDNDGKLSKNRRRQFLGRVPERVFDYIEDVAREIIPPASAVADSGGDSGSDPH